MSEYCEEKMCDGCKIEADCPGFAPLDEIHTCDESCEEGGCPMITEGALPASDIPEIADCGTESERSLPPLHPIG